MQLFKCGHVRYGFWSGAYACEVVYSANPYPERCSSDKGVTRLDIIFATLTIQINETDRIACFGKGYQTFQPGLTNKARY
jgi:hypothetical protein